MTEKVTFENVVLDSNDWQDLQALATEHGDAPSEDDVALKSEVERLKISSDEPQTVAVGAENIVALDEKSIGDTAFTLVDGDLVLTFSNAQTFTLEGFEDAANQGLLVELPDGTIVLANAFIAHLTLASGSVEPDAGEKQHGGGANFNTMEIAALDASIGLTDRLNETASGLSGLELSGIDEGGNGRGDDTFDSEGFSIPAGVNGNDFNAIANVAPIAMADTASVSESGQVVIDVAANDKDRNTDDSFKVVDVNIDGLKGTASITDDGKIRFDTAGEHEDLALGETRTVSFTYTIMDEAGDTSTARVDVTITGENDAPDANPDQFTTDEDGVLRISRDALLANDSDIDGDDIDVVFATDAGNGSAWIDDQGFVNFKPDANFNGDTYFRYTIEDENGARDWQVVRVKVNPINDAPDAEPDQLAMDEDSTLKVHKSVLLANDSDIDGDDIDVVFATEAGNGSAWIDDQGFVNFKPDANFNGDTYFRYTIEDENGARDWQVVRVKVNPVNDAPELDDSTASAKEDGPAVEIDLAALGSDIDNDDDGTTLTYKITGQPGQGSASITGTTLTFEPGQDFQDLGDGESRDVTVKLQATDAHGAVSDEAEIVITVAGMNDEIVVKYGDFSGSVREDSPFFAFKLHDRGSFKFADADATDLHHASAEFKESTHTHQIGNLNAFVAAGSADKVVWKYAAKNYDTQFLGKNEYIVETYTVTLTDFEGSTFTQDISVTIHGRNDKPDAVRDRGTVLEDGPAIVIDLLANDTDPDASDTDLSISKLNLWGVRGDVTDNGDGTITYDPNGAFEYLKEGETAREIFSYSIVDQHGKHDWATVVVTIEGADDATNFSAPTARDQLNGSERLNRGGESRTFTKSVSAIKGEEAQLQMLFDGDYSGGSFESASVYLDGYYLGNFYNRSADVGSGVSGSSRSARVASFDGEVLSKQSVDDVTWNLTLTLTQSFWDKVASDGTVSVTIDNSRWVDWDLGGDDFYGFRLVYDGGASDPIVVDLGDQGISFVNNAVAFDLNADGHAEPLSWTNGQDGILAVDLDGSGAIESGREVFSDMFGEGGHDGSLAALKTQDSNDDGVIDLNDESFEKLLIWVDANQNGVSEHGELMSLSDAGVESIDLNAVLDGYEIDGQEISATGAVSFEDGSVSDYVEVTFVEGSVLEPANDHIADTTGVNIAGLVTTDHDQIAA